MRTLTVICLLLALSLALLGCGNSTPEPDTTVFSTQATTLTPDTTQDITPDTTAALETEVVTTVAQEPEFDALT